jgi:hypothetical protein
MSERIDEIYKIILKQQDAFFKYAQQDSKDKQEILAELKEVHAQTRETNGKVKALRGDVDVLQDKDEKRIIVSKVNWKWVYGIGSVVAFAWSFVSVFIYKWLEKKFFN